MKKTLFDQFNFAFEYSTILDPLKHIDHKMVFSKILCVGIAGLASKKFFSSDQISSNTQTPNRISSFLFGSPVFAGKDAVMDPCDFDNYQRLDLPPKPTEKRLKELLRFGLPCDMHTEVVNFFRHFVMEYDTRTKTPRWVLEHLTRQSVEPPERKISGKKWKEDFNFINLHRPYDVELDKAGTTIKFVRKQLACPKNYNSNNEGFEDTFYGTNTIIVPEQKQEILDNVDCYVREIAKCSINTYVVTGPLFNFDRQCKAKYGVFGDPNMGNIRVAKPVGVFKIVLAETEDENLHLYSFIIPCGEAQCGCHETPAEAFLCSYDKVKELAAIDGFPNIPMTDICTINNRTNDVWAGQDCIAFSVE